MAGYKALQARLANWLGAIGDFSATLDRERVPYLSFSKVGCVEFCGYRYLLEYVRRWYNAVRCLTFAKVAIPPAREPGQESGTARSVRTG